MNRDGAGRSAWVEAQPGILVLHHPPAPTPDTLRSPNRLEFPCLVPWWRPRLSIP